MIVIASGSGDTCRGTARDPIAPRDAAGRVSARRGRGSHHRGTVREASGRQDFYYYLDRRGDQHFSFRQRIWLHREVEMAMTPVMTLALETLAVNLLSRVTRERDQAAAIGATSRRVRRLAPRFCSECLLTANAGGWVMARSSLRDWFVARSRTLEGARGGRRKG